MNLEEIQKIIHMFESASITSLNLESGDLKISLTKEPASVTYVAKKEASEPVKEEDEEPKGFIVKSPLVGTFHRAPYVNGNPFVSVGTKVKKGDKLCIIEAMKVMNEITSPKDGVITNVLCEEGAMAEFDQPLFEIGDENV